MRNVSDKFANKIKSYILCSVLFFNLAVYELLRKNIVEPSRPQMTIWRRRMHKQCNAVWPPDDRRKDARNLLRNNWLPINHYCCI